MANSNLKSQARRLFKIISGFIEIYNEKLSTTLSKDDLSIEELNKVTAAVCKNLPDLFKLHENLGMIINKKDNVSQNFNLTDIIQNDAQAAELIDKLLERISANIEK